MTAAPRGRQLVSIFAAYSAAGVYWGAYIASMPALQAASGLGTAGFGWLLTMTTIGGIIAMQMLGRVHNLAPARAIPLSLVIFAVGFAAIGLARGPVALGAALFLAGAASGALDISLNLRVARLEADFGVRLFNRVHAVFPMAMLVTSLVVGLLRQAGATPSVIFPVAALALVAAAANEWIAGRHQVGQPADPTGGDRPQLRGVLMILGALAALGALMEGSTQTWAAIYVEGALGRGAAIGGVAAASITLGLTAGRLTAHAVEARFRDMQIIRMAVVLMLPALVILILSDTAPLAILGFFVLGIAAGPIEPAVFRAVARRHSDAARGRALALATGLAYAGYLVSPPVMGALIAAAGWGAMWAALGIFAVAAAVLSLQVPPVQTRE